MKFFCVLAVLCFVSSSSLALDREAFTITKYDLEIHIEPGQQRLGARGKITLRNDSDRPQKVVTLQISSSLNWRAIRVAGKAVQYVSQPYVSDIDHTGALSEAIVSLPAEVKPKDSVEVEIGYEGVIPLDTSRLTRVGVPDEIAKRSSWDQISPGFTAVRGAGYVAWYPITTESADFSEGNSLFEVADRWRAREAASEFNVRLSLPDDRGDFPAILCPTDAPASARPAPGSASCKLDRLGAVTPTFVIAKYSVLSKTPLSLFSFPDDKDGVETYSSAIEATEKFVTEWFGAPTMPVDIADFADANSAPFESGTLLMASMAAEDSTLAGTNLVHELVHSAMPSSRPWVYEGLAHFAEAMYRQQQSGRQAALDLLAEHRAALLDSEKEVSASMAPRKNAARNGTDQKNADGKTETQRNAAQKNSGQPLISTFDETYYRSKAAYVWWMLRDMVGDDPLKQAIRKYRAEDDKDSKYVEQLIEAASKRDLSWFFDDWVYHDRGLPDLRVQSAHPWKSETEKQVQFVTVTLENLGNAGAEVPFTVAFGGGEVTRRIEVRARSTATTRVEVPGTPTQIVVNDGSVPESDLMNNVFQIAAQQN